MEYCGPRGIPLSTFLQWPPDDQLAALSWSSEDRVRCPHCGTAEWEWEEDGDAYRAEPRVCRGCHRRGVEEQQLRKQETAMPGIYVRLTKDHKGGVDGQG